MFYEIQPGNHINLTSINYFFLSDSNEIYRNSILIYFQGKKDFISFRFNDSWSCKQAYDKLIAKIYSMDNPSHIKTIMD